MTVDTITTTDAGTSVRFGTQAVVVPAPVSDHLATLIATGRARQDGIGLTPSSRWLFPGHLPGRPITALRLGQRLAAFGIDARAARRAAPTQLAAQVPAVVLAEMLGIAVRTAVDWVHAAGGEWASPADPRTTMRYDRARVSLDRHATYVVAAFLAGAAR